jgi:hypothetical protein
LSVIFKKKKYLKGLPVGLICSHIWEQTMKAGSYIGLIFPNYSMKDPSLAPYFKSRNECLCEVEFQPSGHSGKSKCKTMRSYCGKRSWRCLVQPPLQDIHINPAGCLSTLYLHTGPISWQVVPICDYGDMFTDLPWVKEKRDLFLMHEEHSVPPLSKCQKALPLPSHIF